MTNNIQQAIDNCLKQFENLALVQNKMLTELSVKNIEKETLIEEIEAIFDDIKDYTCLSDDLSESFQNAKNYEDIDDSIGFLQDVKSNAQGTLDAEQEDNYKRNYKPDYEMYGDTWVEVR